MIPTMPSSLMQRSISSKVFSGPTPAFCGRPAMPRNRVGSTLTWRAMASLTASQYQRTIFSGFSECIMV